MKKALASILLIIIFTSCRTTRDEKSMSRVLANPALTERVYEIGLGLHPVSQIQIITPGKDSIVYKYDTIKVNGKDSLIRIACPFVNIDSLKKMLADTVVEQHYYTPTTVNIPDTNSLRRLDLLTGKYNNLLGQEAQKDIQNAALKKESKTRLLWWILSDIIGLFIIGFLTYLLIRKI